MMLEIAVDTDEEWDSSSGAAVTWEPLVRGAIAAAVGESEFPGLTTSARAVEISVLLTGDDRVRRLNAKWRGKDKATNVLSFPMVEPADLRHATIAGPELLLGDIIVARGVCEVEAIEKGISFEEHAAHLLVHGTLHLLGHDHHDDSEAAEMERREIRALGRLGIANPSEVTA
jgi:probable rRNA maturation factor